MVKSKVAEILKKLMLEKKITGTKLAHDIGITKQSISDYLRGNATPKSDILLRMAEYFKVSPEYLLNGIEPQDDNELRLSGDAIRLLKQCDDEMIGYIDKLLSDAEFYREFINAVALCEFEGKRIIKLYQKLQDKIPDKDIIDLLIENSRSIVLSLDSLRKYLLEFFRKNTSWEKATKILTDVQEKLIEREKVLANLRANKE